MGIQSLFIEGGAKILDHFIAEGFWDEARVFTGTKFFKTGINAPSISIESNTHTVFKGSHLDVYFNDLNKV
jgi:diaminohydroxyphosphoribosylaminopyrimidine deaminase/5-amino-6-(5-phosphoribosylamino)uracil reductase